MKVILFMAMSLNGIIAGEDGSEDFLSDANWQTFSDLAKLHGCFIIGRKTFEIVQKWPDYNFNTIDAKLKIIVSKKECPELEAPFVGASSPIDAINKAVAENFNSVILTGGSTLNSAFLSESLVDEIILNVEPAIIGSGIPVFAKGNFEKRLKLLDATKITDDILQVRYKVNK